MASNLEARFNTFRSRPNVRRSGLCILSGMIVFYLVLISIALVGQPSRRAEIVLAICLFLGVCALVMLIRFWMHTTKELSGRLTPAATDQLKRSSSE